MRRKYFLFLILIIIIGGIIFNNIKKIDNPIKETSFKATQNNNLAIMVETEVGSGNYEESSINTWPSIGYTFNDVLSYCENGTALEWNDETRKVILKNATKSDKCYVYFDIQSIYVYKYKPETQTFIAPFSGNYQVELWGAQGGDYMNYFGGKGAYTKGTIYLTKDETLYVYVGNTNLEVNLESFNGGGINSDSNIFGSGGGGATDIRLKKGLWNDFESLKSRIMVAAGGGGANNRNRTQENDNMGYGAGNGGYGGTLVGGNGESKDETHLYNGMGINWYMIGNGGTQVSGGKCTFINNGESSDVLGVSLGTFGKGGQNQSGGGGGYYGGGAGTHSGGGGGSSFISGYDGCLAIEQSSIESNIIHKTNSIHYSGKIFTNSEMIAGNASMPNPTGGMEIGHSGNGYAKITLVS